MLSLYKDIRKGSPERSDTKALVACKGWLHRFRNKFELKNIKIAKLAVSASEEAAATFSAELKKLVKEKQCIHKTYYNIFYNCSTLLSVAHLV